MKAFKNNRLKISLMLLLLVCIVSCGPASGTAPITNQEEADREPASDVEVGTVTTETFSMDYFRFGQGEKTLVILPGLSVQSVEGFADRSGGNRYGGRSGALHYTC